MDNNQRLKLNEMIKTNNVSDQTNLIRNLKHSKILKDEVVELLKINKSTNDLNIRREKGINSCSFLYNYYTDIFNKVKNEEIDINILFSFFDILFKIENGEIDQHEGSFEVGNILKELYIDSALKKSQKLDEKYNNESTLLDNETNSNYKSKEKRDISWAKYKKNKSMYIKLNNIQNKDK